MRVPSHRVLGGFAAHCLTAIALCAVAAEAAEAAAAQHQQHPREGTWATGRTLLQDAAGGDSFFEFEEQQPPIALVRPRCGLFPNPGPCNAALPKWFFSPSSLQCQLFTYGGCQGNDNRFDTLEQCTGNCTGTAPAPSSPLQTPPPATPPPEPDCICPLIYAPVCSTDGQDFPSACQAGCVNAIVARNGTCSGPPPAAVATDAPGRKLQSPSSPKAPSSVPGGGCVCIDNNMPVCDTATGTTYSNPCRADCGGTKAFTKGACPGSTAGAGRRLQASSSTPAPSTVPGGSCVCIDSYAPVCDVATNTTYSNLCRAQCDGVEDFKQGLCPGGVTGRRLAQISAPPPGDCGCPKDTAPVCATDPATQSNITFENACQAACLGASVVSNSSCADPVGVLPPTAAQCSCLRDARPVCDVSTNRTLPSACEAACRGVTTTVDGACPGTGDAAATGAAGVGATAADDSPSTGLQPAQMPPPAACFCTAEYAPVCGSDSNTYPNRCLALCANVTVSSNGTCPLPASSIGAGNDGNSMQGGLGLPQPAPNPVCLQSVQPGPCRASLERWYWDSATLQCSNFTYGGCQGNGNRFETQAACEATCRVASMANAAAQQSTLALRVAGCSDEWGVALSVTGAAPAAVVAIFKTFTGAAASGLAAGHNLPGEAVFRSKRCGQLPLGLVAKQSFFPRTVRADGTGVAYLSLAPASQNKTHAACHDTLYVAVDTRTCTVTAPVKWQ